MSALPPPHAPAPPPPPEGIEPLTPDDPRYVGPFRLVGRIGSGGMGTVYAALDDADRRVAVKCVHRVHAGDADFRVRFAREVALVRRVRAACVPAFVRADTRSRTPWLATEYVPGLTLDAHVRAHGPLFGAALHAFALGVAEALAAIHRTGVVHRDLKPGNVILSPDGPKVLDFGIARAMDETALTRTGDLVGTPGWIAPEQYTGREACDRSDMFAWAGLVAFAATGRNPFGSGGSDVMAARILSDPPDLAGLPGGLLELVARALDKDPARRPDAATAVRETSTRLGSSDAAADAGARAVELTLKAAWAGACARDDGQSERWRHHAPPRRPWVRRHGRTLSLGAAGLVLAVLAGTGIGALSSDGAGAAPGDGQAAARPAPPAEGSDAGAGGEEGDTAGLADVPAEYHHLYANGTVSVEPVPGDSAQLVRRIGTGEGEDDGLDQLRLEFTRGERFTGSVAVTVTAEYLLDFGGMSVHSDDFAWTNEITPEQDGLDFLRPGSRGVLAELTPQDPVAEFSVTVIAADLGGVFYYLPAELLDEEHRVAIDYPGGFCDVTPARGKEQELAGFADSPGLAPHDTTLEDGVPVNSCAYREESVWSP